MWSTAFMFILVLTLSFGNDDLIVNLSAGNIRGHILKTYEGNIYYAFQEIPYAAPAVGENRFQLPKPPEPWNGILNTTKNTKVCQQANKYKLEKTEDCLYLNVYSPVKPGGNDKLPVLFWIHGGGLNWGSGTFDDYGPKYIMDYGIVVVAINYRLNAFGFASTDDDVIPGNLGLKDQRFALEWVNQHINLFGGDPDHVTIAGESSGSAAVGLLVMGNWNGEKELFHAAIQESGSMIGGTLQKNAKENIIGLAKYLDPTFDSEESEDILKVLKKASAEDIIKWSSDQSFSTPTGKQIELGCAHAPYFVYQFAYKGDLGGMMDDIYIVPGAERVGHMEDLHYWWEFLNNSDMNQFPEEDRLMMRRFLTLWTNFIKYYNPTPKADPLLLNVTWPMSNPDSLTYLNINSTFEVRENPRVYRYVKPIIEKYMEPPYVSFG
uniref:Carboxylic ester hydrolase n=1 Tax=Diabrotica virgifera virgifera TaxID=50390 RepID=A0A6P7FI42_DIAVI